MMGTQVIDALIDGTVLQEEVDERDAEGRVKCVRALGSVCSSLHSSLLSTDSPEPGAASRPLPLLDLLLKKVGAGIDARVWHANVRTPP